MPDSTLDLLKAQDVADWREHAGWEMVLAPAIQQHRDLLTRQLVELSLGKQVAGLTLEQVAGKIYGIDWLIKELDTITRRGRTAEGLRPY